MKNDYEIRGEVAAIFIKRKDGSKVETIIDTEDLERIKSIPVKWGSSPKERYIRARLLNSEGITRLRLHRIIANTPDDMVADHINGNTFDNRKANLRNITASENLQNQHRAQANNISKKLCVTWNKYTEKWVVLVKRKYIGSYKDVNEASKIAECARAILLPYSEEARNIEKLPLDILNEVQKMISGNGRCREKQPRKQYKKQQKTKVCKPTISWHSRDKRWQVRISSNGKRKYLGCFKTKEEAEEFVKNQTIQEE